jgi:uncharacterized membrane protein
VYDITVGFVVTAIEDNDLGGAATVILKEVVLVIPSSVYATDMICVPELVREEPFAGVKVHSPVTVAADSSV